MEFFGAGWSAVIFDDAAAGHGDGNNLDGNGIFYVLRCGGGAAGDRGDRGYRGDRDSRVNFDFAVQDEKGDDFFGSDRRFAGKFVSHQSNFVVFGFGGMVGIGVGEVQAKIPILAGSDHRFNFRGCRRGAGIFRIVAGGNNFCGVVLATDQNSFKRTGQGEATFGRRIDGVAGVSDGNKFGRNGGAGAVDGSAAAVYIVRPVEFIDADDFGGDTFKN